MSKKRILSSLLPVVALIIILLLYLQFGREESVYNSRLVIGEESSEEQVSVVMNRLFVLDEEKVAREVLEKCIDNEFQNFRFSYDIAKPTSMEIRVYLSKSAAKRGDMLFSFTAESTDKTENMIDSPENVKTSLSSSP